MRKPDPVCSVGRQRLFAAWLSAIVSRRGGCLLVHYFPATLDCGKRRRR